MGQRVCDIFIQVFFPQVLNLFKMALWFGFAVVAGALVIFSHSEFSTFIHRYKIGGY